MFEEPAGGWPLALGKAKLTWSADATTVTKTAVPHLVIPHWAIGPRQAARNELRVNRLLGDVPPPVAGPALVRWSRREPSMTFEAVDCVPLGPKFPSSLTGTGVDDLVAMALATDAYRPRRRWFRRQRIDARLRLHQSAGLLSEPDAQAPDGLGRSRGIKWHFAHGDVTARNVLCDQDGRSLLIDWEWAWSVPGGLRARLRVVFFGHLPAG